MDTKGGEVKAVGGEHDKPLRCCANGYSGITWIETQPKSLEPRKGSGEGGDDIVIYRRGTTIATRVPDCEDGQLLECEQRRIIRRPGVGVIEYEC